MKAVMRLDAMIKSLFEELELEPLEADEKGVYALAVGDKIIEIAPHLEGFSFHAAIGPFPEKEKETFALHALHGNLFGQGTRDAILGINEGTNQLTLSKFVDYTVNYKEFRDCLEDFVNTMDFWAKQTV